jgi:hypothetical protein
MDTLQKLAMLKEVCADDAEFERVVSKLLDITLSQQWRR